MEDIGIKLLFKTTLCLVFAKFVREFLATASIAKKLTKFRNDIIAELCVRLVHTECRASKNGYVRVGTQICRSISITDMFP